MSRLLTSNGWIARSFPRVSGDEPYYIWNDTSGQRFSPRERG